MKKLLFLACLLIFTPAIAGSYEDAADIETACDMIGRLGAQNFRMKQNGTPYNKDQDKHLGSIKDAARYGYFKAPTEESAYLKGWALCKDSYSK